MSPYFPPNLHPLSFALVSRSLALPARERMKLSMRRDCLSR
jgi:hypothetical protein